MAFWTNPLPGFMRNAVAPIVVTSGEGVETSAVANITVAKRPETVQGDLMVAFFIGPTTLTSVTLAGWTVALAQATPNIALHILTKKAGASEPSNYTFVAPAVNKKVMLINLRGGSGEIDVLGTPARANTSTPSATSITALTSGTLIAFFGQLSTSGPSPGPPGMTLIATRSNAPYSETAFKLENNGPGATGSKSMTWMATGSPVTGQTVSILVQLK